MRYKFLLTTLCAALIGTAANAQTDKLDWAKAIGGNSSNPDHVEATITDDSGNVYSTGRFYNTGIFDTGAGVTGVSSIVSAGSADIFITKHDKDGNFRWVKTFGGTKDDFGLAIVLDKDANIYVTGSFQNSVDFDNDPNTPPSVSLGAEDIYVMKLDRNGNFVWVRTVAGTATDQGFGIALDTWNNVVVTGWFTNTVDFDPSSTGTFNLTSSASGKKDVFIWKLTNNGDFDWAKMIGKTATPKGIATDPWGNVYTTGFMSGTADFNPDTAAAAVYNLKTSGTDAYVSKLDSAGHFVWAKLLGGPSTDQAWAITVDKKGNVFTTGRLGNGGGDFDPDTSSTHVYTVPMNAAIGGGYVSKLDSAGKFVWAKGIDGDWSLEGHAIALDNSGNVYTTGFFIDTAYFDTSRILVSVGPGPMSNAYEDIYVLKLDSTGKFISVDQMGGNSTDFVLGMTVDKFGYIYTCGYYGGNNAIPADFDPDTSTYMLNTHGHADGFLVKIGVCTIHPDAVALSSCGSYMFNNQKLDTSGTYVYHIPVSGGCDSVVTLNLTVNNIIPVAINVNGNLLGTASTYSSYQWYLNDTAITGATTSTYTVTANGDYKVVVTDTHGCTDTSTKYTVAHVGVNNVNAVAQNVIVYPNPATSIVNVSSSVAVTVTVTSIEGKAIKTVTNAKSINIKDLADGVYLLRITSPDGALIKVEKLIKSSN